MSEQNTNVESQNDGLSAFNSHPGTPFVNQAMKKLEEMKGQPGTQDNVPAKEEGKKQEEPAPKEVPKDDDAGEEPARDNKETEQSKKETVSSESQPSEDFKALYEKLQKESEIKEKRAEDNQRHTRQIARSISAIKKHIMELQESGELEEDMAASILNVASKDIDPDKILMPDAKGSKEKLPEHIEGMMSLTSQAAEVLEKYLELSPNEGDEKKYAQGFDLHLNLLSDEGKKNLYEALKKQGESPKALLKSMLEIGKGFWDSSLGKGFQEHGDLIGIIDHQASKIDDLNKMIEKLTKAQKKEQEKDEDFKSTVPLKTDRKKHDIFNTAEVMKQTQGFGDIVDILGGKA